MGGYILHLELKTPGELKKKIVKICNVNTTLLLHIKIYNTQPSLK